MRYDFAEDGGSSMMKCPSCGYASDSAKFAVDGGAAGTSDPAAPSSLQTPQPGTGFVRDGVPLTVRGASSTGLANGSGRAITLARRMPVQQVTDIVVSRNPDGTAVIRHRLGGTEIGKLKPTAAGWVPEVGGRDGQPQRQQRGALLSMFGAYNRDVAGQPLQPPPAQTPLMQQFGVPAIRLAADDSSDSSGSDDAGTSGLTPKGKSIYQKLIDKGMSPKVAMAMAKRAQNFGTPSGTAKD